MPKDIYKTFKRSISAVTGVGTSSNNSNSAGASNNGESSSTPSTSSSSVKYRGGSGRTWIHPPDFLINGRVEYVARFLGTVETAKAHGSDVAREAIHAIRFQRDLKRSEQTRETAKLQKVDIQISIDNVVIADTKTKQVLYKFPLGRISFCADDKDDKRMFSFIARAEGQNSKHNCFAFTSEKLAEEITLTIGEAFDLAYKRFLDKNRSSLENQKQVFILRKRIAELEAENQVLSQRLAEAIRANKGSPGAGGNFGATSLMDAPALPCSPMPKGPPPNLPANLPVAGGIYSTPRPATIDDLMTAPLEIAPKLPSPNRPPPRAPAVLPPPPPIAPRRQTLAAPSSGAAGIQQLEGVELKSQGPVFDDDFDPRAGEKENGGTNREQEEREPEEEQKKGYDPFGDDFLTEKLAAGPSSPSTSTPLAPPNSAPKTAADFQAMIENVEKKLAEIGTNSDDFGQFETGELSGMEAENAYGVPSDQLNAQVMNLKKQ